MGRTVLYYSDELYHHGIKGQKWGVRRYQNEDGTLTKAGRDRYLDRADKHIAKISKSSTRIGKNLHNQAAALNTVASNIRNDWKNADTLSRKVGSVLGSGAAASVADAGEDFYSRQREYRKTKLGKHLSSVNEFNQHNIGTSSESVYNAKGIINKGKQSVKAVFATPVKTIVGRETKSGEAIAVKVLDEIGEAAIDVKVGSIAKAAVDVGYLGTKAIKKARDKQ